MFPSELYKIHSFYILSVIQWLQKPYKFYWNLFRVIYKKDSFALKIIHALLNLLLLHLIVWAYIITLCIK